MRFSKSKYPDKDHDAKILEIAFYANEVMRNALGNHYVRPISIGFVLSFLSFFSFFSFFPVCLSVYPVEGPGVWLDAEYLKFQ